METIAIQRKACARQPNDAIIAIFLIAPSLSTAPAFFLVSLNTGALAPQTAPNPADRGAANKPVVAPEKPDAITVYLSQNRMLVMRRIGSNPPVPVVFNTGTNGNLLDLGLADSLKLPNTGPFPSADGSTGKPVPGHETFIKDPKLGEVAISDARATAMDYVQNLPLTLPLKQIEFATSAAGNQPIYSARLNGSLKIGGLVLDQPEIRFMKGGVPNIALPILRQLIIVMDPSRHRDWVLASDVPTGIGTPPAK